MDVNKILLLIHPLFSHINNQSQVRRSIRCVLLTVITLGNCLVIFQVTKQGFAMVIDFICCEFLIYKLIDCPSGCEVCESNTLCIECSYSYQRYIGASSAIFSDEVFTGLATPSSCASRSII